LQLAPALPLLEAFATFGVEMALWVLRNIAWRVAVFSEQRTGSTFKVKMALKMGPLRCCQTTATRQAMLRKTQWNKGLV